ncbi:MAG: family 43 glycosylhydrolase [Clostridia bacterium]|nr:family 43 glycosylhydrolase [Clostridia bacterium]
MKKIISVFCVLAMLFTCCIPAFASAEYPFKTADGNIRDPYVLVYDGKYYMYGTGLSNGQGYGCVVSEDLENWSAPIQVFSPDASFDGYCDYWAPECHYYNGAFYLFATYRAKSTDKRGVGVFKSDSPTGPFVLISDGHITPKEVDCIDGTLYVDEDGQPWMVFVNEWTSREDKIGAMSVVKMSDDLTHFVSEPKEIFRADRHLWTDGNITDGPFVYRTSEGNLVMLWSNHARSGGYAVGMAVSDNGKIDGNWLHYPVAMYKRTDSLPDGGHPMLFTTLDGQLMMAIHAPNASDETVFETAIFIPMQDNGKILVHSDGNFFSRTADTILGIVFDVYRILYGLFHK